MAKKVQLEVEIKGNDSVAQASEKTKALKENIQKLKETLATGGLGEKEYQKANDQLQKYEDKLKKSETATKSLKSQLRELQNDLQSGKLTGKEFDEGVRRAAAMKDQIIDVNNRVKALATDGPDVMLKGFGDMAAGIIGGFSAAQGAMALFGSENEDLQKQLIKLQGATALLNGIQQVNATLQGDSAAMVALNTAKTKILTFVQLRYAAAVGTSTGAMKALRIVGMTLGIGVIVAAVGLLIANFDKVKAVVMGVVDRFKGLSGTTKNILSVMFPFIGVIRLVYAGLEKLGAFAETAADRYEKLEKANQKQSKQMEREIDLMEAQGASARDLYLAKHRQLMLDYETMEAKRKLIGLTTEEQEAQKDLANSINILNAQETKRQNDDAKKRQDDANKANDEAVKKRKEAQDKKVEQQKKDAEEIKKLIADEREKQRERDLSEQAKEIDALQDAAKEKMLIAKGNAEAEKLIRENLSKDVAALNEKYRLEAAEKEKEAIKKLNEEKEALDKEHLDKVKEYKAMEAQTEIDLQDAKIQAVQTGAQILGQFAGQSKALALTALAIEKGAAIAGVIINASRELSANSLTASLNPLNASTFGAAGAAQLAKSNALTKIRAGISIASISAAGISGARNITSGGGSSGGGGSVQPPNIRGSQTTNEPTSQPATKVFVTETDIRSVTRKVDGIFTQATIQ
jgi:hypothetical protein